MNYFEMSETFVNAVDTGSVLAAARKLNQTSAAVSKKLSKLEDWLGVQLLIRDKKGIRLTEIGLHYYHEVKEAIHRFKKAELIINEAVNAPTGTLRVVSNQFYAQNWIIPKIGNFMNSFPSIRLHLETAEILPDFTEKNMDVLFGVSLPACDDLARKRIATTRYVLCATPKYLAKLGIPRYPSDLSRYHFIAHISRKNSNAVLLDQGVVIDVKPTLLLNNTELIIKAALENLGIIWTHKSLVDEHLCSGRLVSILDCHLKQEIQVYAYYPYQRLKDPKIRAFLNFFQAVEKE